MKTTLDIPSSFLSEAVRFAGAKTKRAAVLASLDDFSKRGRMREMAMRLGNSKTFVTAVDLETNNPNKCNPPNGYPRHASCFGSFLTRQESDHGHLLVFADVLFDQGFLRG